MEENIKQLQILSSTIKLTEDGATFWITIIVSLIISVIFLCLQIYFFRETRKYRIMFHNFFNKRENYGTFKREMTEGEEPITQLVQVGSQGSDLNYLIVEINHYVAKTKGTTDFTVIQNKVERKLNMRYDQSTARLAFPTYLGLMGTFLGVFMGILMFILGFDGAGNISDDSIKNLLVGVLVSMFTSLCGLFLTTYNNGKAGSARKKIEEDKNEFYDFVQTELMPSLDVSLVLAITKLHETVDRFEPAFDRVINRFQETFDRCTSAFGDEFETHVNTVAHAVDVMGEHMDKINQNINLQGRVLEILKSDEIVKGLDKYIEASNHFAGITQSLDKFEDARRMMLVAANESIKIQNQNNGTLKISMEIALRINQILDRIKDFEKGLNAAGRALSKRDILGNDIVEAIQEQVKGISRKGKIADKYIEMADGKLEELYHAQIAKLDEINIRYQQALKNHIEGFEGMITSQTEELEKRHELFVGALEERFQIEQIRQEFSNLTKLDTIDNKLSELANASILPDLLQKALQEIKTDLNMLKSELSAINRNTRSNRGGITIFGRSDRK